MQGLHFVLMFTALTFLSWGAYGPLLRYGTTAMGHDGLKAFVGVGLAYFVIAVIVPFWILSKSGEKGKWTIVGTTYSIIAGSVGAIGALGIILALVFKGNPVYVMPLVFGFAPIVNTLVTAWMGGTLHNIRPIFIGGIIAAALGAGGVLIFKPSPQAAAKPPAIVETETEHDADASAKPEGQQRSTQPKTSQEPLALSSGTSDARQPETTASASAKREPAPGNVATPSNSSAVKEPAVKEVSPSASEVKSAGPLKTALLPDTNEPPAPELKPVVQPVATSVIAAAMPDPTPAPAPEAKPKPEPTTAVEKPTVSPITAAMPDSTDAPAPERKPVVTSPGQAPAADGNNVEPPPVEDPKPASLDPVSANKKSTEEKPAASISPAQEKPPADKPAEDKPAAGKPAEDKPAREKPAAEDKPAEPRAQLPEAGPAPAPERPALPPLANRSEVKRGYLTMQRGNRSDSDLEVADESASSQSSEADEHKAEDKSSHGHAAETKPNYWMIALSIAMAAVCWGSYGPMLHKGQMKMGGSRLRPFACVGIAYFIIAVAAPLVLLSTTPSISQGSWSGLGLFWSIIAGGAGALGALGIILAFNSGGKPIYVMPLVFGFAPVINTFISLTEVNAWSRVQPMFWVSLAVVIAGAITVLITAPKAHHGPATAAPAAGTR